jgi:hypothetical protein
MCAFGKKISFVVFGIYETMSSIYLSYLLESENTIPVVKKRKKKKRDMNFALDGFWLFIFSRHTLSVPK